VSVTTPSPYLDNTVVANTTYVYRVTAVNGTQADGVTPNRSNTLTATVLTPPTGLVVSAPINLTAAVSFAQSRITLTWTDTAVNETAFVVERSVDGVNFSQIGTAAARNGSPATAGNAGQTRTFVDAAVSSGQTYWYRVKAENVTGAVTTQSNPTPAVKVDFFLAAPAGLSATIARTNRITLSWSDTTSAEASFAVWRATNGGAFTQIGTVTRSAAQATAVGGPVSFNDNTTFVLGNTYQYYVTATNGAVVSPPSNTYGVPFVAPAAPAALNLGSVTLTGATRATVALNWAAMPGLTFTLQRIAPAALGGGTTTLLNNSAATTFNDTGLRRNAQPYRYQIRSNGPTGASAWTMLSVTAN